MARQRKSRVRLPTTKVPPSTVLSDYILGIYGPPGVGKSTFVNSLAPRVLIFSTDRGTRFMERLPVEITRWEDFKAAIRLLKKKKGGDFDLYAVDHVDDWLELAEDFVLRKLNIDGLSEASWGQGWKMYKKEVRTGIMDLMRFGKGLVFVSHEKMTTVKTKSSEYIRLQPNLSKSGRQLVIPILDVLAYAHFDRERRRVKVRDRWKRKMVDVRKVAFQPCQEFEAKDRPNRCPLEPINLDGGSFIELFMKGQTNGKAKQEIESKSKRQGRRSRKS